MYICLGVCFVILLIIIIAAAVDKKDRDKIIDKIDGDKPDPKPPKPPTPEPPKPPTPTPPGPDPDTIYTTPSGTFKFESDKVSQIELAF